MRRREALTGIAGVGMAFLAGCADTDTDHEFDIDTPDLEKPEFNVLTAEEPKLTETSYQAFSLLDTLAVYIRYDVRNHSHDYSVQVTVESEEATSETEFALQQVQGRYPGIGGSEIPIPEESDGFPSPSMTVSLLEDAGEVDFVERTLRRL